MDSSAMRAAGFVEDGDDDEWDADGFVIPSLGIVDADGNQFGGSEVEISKAPSTKAKTKENIYLGPHGAPPSQMRLHDVNRAARKQNFRQKLMEADRRTSGVGRENKLENLRELVGNGRVAKNMPGSSQKDWLDPHCNESMFERRASQ